MIKPILIFDFDGTIADTLHHFIAISNRLAKIFHYKVIEKDEIEHLKDMSSIEIIRYLQIPIYKIPAIVARAKRELHRDISSVHPIAGLEPVLKQLRDSDVTLGILSSNSNDNIMKFLKNHGLDFFHFIFPASKIWSKNISLKIIIEKNGFDKKHIIYIGDEIRDIVAARKLGIKIASVGWGYNSIASLQKHRPDFLIKDPVDLFKLYPR